MQLPYCLTPFQLFSTKFFDSSFPSAHSIGRLCPIFKSGDEHHLDNNCGITVSTILSKLYATVLERRISGWAEEHGLRAAGQAGFRRDHRTTDNIFIMRRLIESCKAMKTSHQHGRLYACLVDFRKAFDTIPRNKLWEHLSSIGVQGKMLEALKSYYANVRVCVDIPGVGTSAPFDSTMGVKQGCPMSPTLFGLYIDQLEHHLQSHDHDAPQLLDTKVSILLYADDIVLLSKSPSGLQHRLDILQLLCSEKLLTVNMSKTQVVIFSDVRHSHADHFTYSHQQLQIVLEYTYLGIVLHKSGSYKHAISKLTAAGKHALFAMQYRCSDLGIDDIGLRCSLFSSLVQPVLSYGCEIWGLEHANSWECMSSVHHLFLKRTLHVRKSPPTEAVMCELDQMPLHLFWRKLLLRFVVRVVDLPGSRLVKKAFMQAQQSCTPWFQNMSSWLHDNGFQGLLSDGTFSFSTALTSLRDTWVSQVYQSTSTKVQYFIDTMHFDSDNMATYLQARPSPALFSLIKFRLGAHWLRGETDRGLLSPRDKRICQHCHMQAVEDEQHFLFDCPLYTQIREQHEFLSGLDHGSIRLFLERNAAQMSVYPLNRS